jgi:hypothetical protein
MSKYCGKALLLIVVVCLAVVLHFLLPLIVILEIALNVFVILLTVWVVSLVDDKIHLHRVRRQLREAHLRRIKSQLPPRQSRY